MSHWAEIDENNVVLRVLVGNNDEPGEGYDWLIENLGGTWLQTSYNGTIRKNFAGVGFTYNEELDAFLPPQEFASWTLNKQTFQWDPPVAYPASGGPYLWDEDSVAWVEVEDEAV